MARAITSKALARKPRMKAAESTPKRKPGRPIGSTKTKKTPAVASPRAAKPAVKRGVVSKAAPAAPKMSKVELESHVSKLERSVSRLREKNKELKQAAVDAREHADHLEEQLSARPAPAPKAPKAPKASRKTGRGSASTAAGPSEPMDAETSET